MWKSVRFFFKQRHHLSYTPFLFADENSKAER